MSAREDAIDAVASQIRSASFDGRTVEDPRVAAEGLLESGVVVLTADHEAEVERLRAIETAFAELPASTRALAHAAATVRARLGEGWEQSLAPDDPRQIDCLNDWTREYGYRTKIHLYLHDDDRWEWWCSAKGGIVGASGHRRCDSLDDAITAALAVLGETES